MPLTDVEKFGTLPVLQETKALIYRNKFKTGCRRLKPISKLSNTNTLTWTVLVLR